MQRGIVCGFGEYLPFGDLAELRARGVEIVRQDGRAHGRFLDPVRCVELAQQVLDNQMSCLFICHTLEQLRAIADRAVRLPADRLQAEWGNEPDLPDGPRPPIPPAEYATDMRNAADMAAARGLTLYVGSISNFNQRGLNYLRAIRPSLDQCPPATRVSIHRYAHGNSPTTPHAGFSSRVDELATFKAIIGDRRWAVTEFGFMDSWRQVSGPWYWFGRKVTRRWTPQQVAQFVRDDFERWEAAGADAAYLYQLNDEQYGLHGVNYGIRAVREDGTPGEWKPVAETFRESSERP